MHLQALWPCSNTPRSFSSFSFLSSSANIVAPHPPIFFFFFYFLVLYSFPGSLIRCQPMGGPFFFFFFFYFAIFLSFLIPRFPFWPRPLNLEDGVCSKRGKKREKKTFQTNKINQEEGRPRPSLLARRNNTRSSRRKSLTAGERAAESCPVQKKKVPPLGCVFANRLSFPEDEEPAVYCFLGRTKKRKFRLVEYCTVSLASGEMAPPIFSSFSPLWALSVAISTPGARPGPRLVLVSITTPFNSGAAVVALPPL